MTKFLFAFIILNLSVQFNASLILKVSEKELTQFKKSSAQLRSWGLPNSDENEWHNNVMPYDFDGNYSNT